jgi:crotonobetainyl-CoA:carnitine CoA-transferase CaiB-like acyl-CoA transferase
MDEVFADPQVMAREILKELDHPRHGLVKTIGLPFGFSSFKNQIKSPAPLLGEHSEEILSGALGFDSDTISQLVTDGVIRKS